VAQQRHGLGADRVPDDLQARHQARVRRLVAAEEVLQPGAHRGELDARGDGVGGHEGEALDRRGVGVGELAGRPVGARLRGEQRGALGRRGAEQPQRGGEAQGGSGRRGGQRGLAGLAQDRDRLQVAVARRPLHVMGALERRDAARGERARAALVRAEPPAAGRGLVDRAPHERMPEAEAPRHVGLAHEVEAEQLVQRVQCARLVLQGGGGGGQRARTGRPPRRRPAAAGGRRSRAAPAPRPGPRRPRAGPRLRRTTERHGRRPRAAGAARARAAGGRRDSRRCRRTARRRPRSRDRRRAARLPRPGSAGRAAGT
jgi:hypothetical protein